MNKYIFICRRNIFRSQIAYGLCNKIGKGNVIAESYGTQVDNEGYSNKKISQFPGMTETIELLKKNQIDISNEVCKQVTPDSLIDATKIIVMSEREYIPEWLNKFDFEYWDINYPENINTDYTKNLIDALGVKVMRLLQVKD